MVVKQIIILLPYIIASAAIGTYVDNEIFTVRFHELLQGVYRAVVEILLARRHADEPCQGVHFAGYWLRLIFEVPRIGEQRAIGLCHGLVIQISHSPLEDFFHQKYVRIELAMEP